MQVGIYFSYRSCEKRSTGFHTKFILNKGDVSTPIHLFPSQSSLPLTITINGREKKSTYIQRLSFIRFTSTNPSFPIWFISQVFGIDINHSSSWHCCWWSVHKISNLRKKKTEIIYSIARRQSAGFNKPQTTERNNFQVLFVHHWQVSAACYRPLQNSYFQSIRHQRLHQNIHNVVPIFYYFFFERKFHSRLVISFSMKCTDTTDL